ncbi:MAG: hypothetical protein COA74_13940 [Gammaproteobacteria bacterium]|nr:MAG: hypothetical protein COA74_13940 [Gammaproteobacteria bacterium]
MEIDQQTLQFSIMIFKFLGIGTIGGFIALYSAWLAFPPEIIIEGIIDKSKSFNSESKIKVKNTGRLPALSVKADAEKICAKIGGMTMQDCGIKNGPDVIGRLTHNETSEISIRPGIALGQGMKISEFSYELTLKKISTF